MKRQRILHDEKELLLAQSLNVNELRGPGACPPHESLKLRSSEVAGNVYFCIHFCILKVFKEGNQGT